MRFIFFTPHPQTMKHLLRIRSFKDLLLKLPLFLILALILVYYYLLVAGSPPKPRALIRLNNSLPPPKLSNEMLDKMLLYRKARMDSLAREGRNPRWMQQGLLEADSPAPASTPVQLPWLEDPGPLDSPDLATPPPSELPAPGSADEVLRASQPAAHQDPLLQPAAAASDPVVPGKVKASMVRRDSSWQAVTWYNVPIPAPESTGSEDSIQISVLEPSSQPKPDTEAFSHSHPLKVCIDRDQTVRNGERVALRLLESCRIRGHLMKAGSRIYGRCTLQQDRLLLRASVLPVADDLVPIAWEALAPDGQPGIYLPGMHVPLPLQQAMSPHLSAFPGWPMWSPYSVAPGLSALLFSGGLPALKRLWEQHQQRQRMRLPEGLPLLLVPRT